MPMSGPEDHVIKSEITRSGPDFGLVKLTPTITNILKEYGPGALAASFPDNRPPPKIKFGIGDVDSPWALSMKMKEIMRFIAQNLPPGTDQETVRNTEYAATNGMLSTLDPHSILMDPSKPATWTCRPAASSAGSAS